MTSLMAQEIAEIPAVFAKQAQPDLQADFASLGGMLREAAPEMILTVARGSSAHAAAYLAHAAGRLLGLPVAPVGASLCTVYGAELQAHRALALAISQSGSSADLSQVQAMLAGQGAIPIVLTNTPDSRLAQTTPNVIGMNAGPEQAVAATKSYAASVSAGLWLLAHWSGDQPLQKALFALAETVSNQQEAVVAGVADAFSLARHLVVIGRGPGLGIAREVALKLQELCGMHASSFSAAELLHGPRAMLTEDTPVIALRRGSGGGLKQAVEGMAGQGVPVHFVGASDPVLHPLVDPLLDLIPLYRALEAAARARGRSPDAPKHLRKETITV